MAVSIVNIRNNIKSTLEAVVQDDGTAKITVVYKYPESQSEGYPYAIIDFVGSEEEEHSNIQDKVNYEFNIRVIQEKIEELKGREAAEETTIDRAYAIATAFRKNNDLGLAGVIRVLPLKTEKRYTDNNTRIELVITLLVQTLELIKVA
jgi:hypothetical protein